MVSYLPSSKRVLEFSIGSRRINIVAGSGGKWWFTINGDKHGPFESNAAAWTAFDKASSDPINRSEDVSEWLSKQPHSPE